MKIVTTDYFLKVYKKKISRNPVLQEKFIKQMQYLEMDIKHPSLRTHKLQGKRASEYSISIEGNVRVLLYLVENEAVLTDIINHDEY